MKPSLKKVNLPLRMLLFIIIVVVVVKNDFIEAQRYCYTPRRNSGQCVHYKQCRYLTDQLTKYGQSIPQSIYADILARRCESPNNEIFICCETQFIQTSPITPTTLSPAPPPTKSTPASTGINQRGLTLLNSVQCGAPPDNRVAFGEVTNLAEFPWMALLRYNSPEQYNCGGSLITNRYVLTAAHCTIGQKYNLIGVRLGEHDLGKEIDCQKRGQIEHCSPPVEDYGIERAIPHPQYKSIRNDIALIRLDRDVIFKIHIRPICLPITDTSRGIPVDQKYFISGWGTTENGSASKILLKALVPHKDWNFCQKLFRTSESGDYHICAGGENRIDSCKGDSGGPLFFLAPYKRAPRYVQYGVVSFGVAACGPIQTYPTLYTRVESFLPWITNNIV